MLVGGPVLLDGFRRQEGDLTTSAEVPRQTRQTQNLKFGKEIFNDQVRFFQIPHSKSEVKNMCLNRIKSIALCCRGLWGYGLS